ncbi:MAG: CTP-dependent riboflavin kinase [Candidatus Thorarchaeota archaeon]|nr:CTP-dependent riboflavin kinase [Candidatus Thorarchaeota archaeon]
MIKPEIWFTLYTLAKRGALHDTVLLKTSQLGKDMEISQQTASRRISECVEYGFLVRVHTVNGMQLRINGKGREELLKVFSSLEIAFAPPKDEISIQGHIVGGLGEGAYYVEVYRERFRKALGFEPFAGTLNVRVTEEESRKAINRMKHTPPLMVTGFNHEGRTFGDVICYRVKVNDKIEAAIVIAQRTHHSRDILEIIAPVDIRKALKLDDEAEVTLTVVPLHMAI